MCITVSNLAIIMPAMIGLPPKDTKSASVCVATWPPALGQWPQLPQAVRLEFETETGPRVIVATPDGPTEPAPRVRDVSGQAVMQ